MLLSMPECYVYIRFFFGGGGKLRAVRQNNNVGSNLELGSHLVPTS